MDGWKGWWLEGGVHSGKEGNRWGNDDWKWEETPGKSDDKWEGEEYGGNRWDARRDDRRNEMVAKGFKYDTYWKEIKSKFEEVMGVSRVAYGQVKAIGEKSSSAIIHFDDSEKKREFKLWLGRNGEEVKKERGIWFGDNINRDARARERAVGKVKMALMKAREERTDVYSDYNRGLVYVGDEVVAKLDAEIRVMTFAGEGKEIRTKYKELMDEGRREQSEFSE